MKNKISKKVTAILAGASIALLVVGLIVQSNSVGNMVQAQQNIGAYLGDPTAKPNISPPPFEKVKVYIFPRDIHKFQYAGELASEIKQLAGIRLAMDYGQTTGAAKQGIYDINADIAVPNGTEFYISPDLKKPNGTPITVDDLVENMSYGNGLTVADIGIKPDKEGDDMITVPAIWFVVGEPDIPTTDAKVEMIRMTVQNHVSSEAAFKQLYP